MPLFVEWFLEWLRGVGFKGEIFILRMTPEAASTSLHCHSHSLILLPSIYITSCAHFKFLPWKRLPRLINRFKEAFKLDIDMFQNRQLIARAKFLLQIDTFSSNLMKQIDDILKNNSVLFCYRKQNCQI